MSVKRRLEVEFHYFSVWFMFYFLFKGKQQNMKKMNNKPPHFTPIRRGLLILQPPTCVSGIEQALINFLFLRFFSYHEKALAVKFLKIKAVFIITVWYSTLKEKTANISIVFAHR